VGTLLVVNRDGDIIHGFLPMAHFGARLFELEEAINFCFARGLLKHPQQWEVAELRLHVLVLTSTGLGEFQVFRGDGERTLAYAHLLNREGDISLNQAKTHVRNCLGILGVKSKIRGELLPAGNGGVEGDNKARRGTTLGTKDDIFGQLVGVQLKQERIIFCWECYKKEFGPVIYPGSMEAIYDAEGERIVRKGTSGFYLGDQEVILCHICGRVLMKLPPKHTAEARA
jgi:hypothetical protein